MRFADAARLIRPNDFTEAVAIKEIKYYMQRGKQRETPNPKPKKPTTAQQTQTEDA
jgi:hypothetical protein